jgi:DNA-binding NarL/FixJ family response regulator
MKNGCKIVIADDHPLFREGLHLIVEKLKIGQVIAEAENGFELIKLLETLQPDVVLMDIDMPVMNGIEATEKALEMHPGLKILVFSMYNEKKYYSQILKVGAKGMVLKTAGKKEFETAIRIVANGGSHFSSEFVEKMIADEDLTKKRGHVNHEVAIKLTPRETDILRCLCSGFSALEIADKLCISIKTVEHYRSKLLDKAGVKNTVGLVLFAIKNNLVTL